jgi:hypothetical protein
MKWMKERDLLIAQTMAFVQSVAAKRPDTEVLTAAPSMTAVPATTLPADVPVTPPPLSAAPIVLAEPKAAQPSMSVPPPLPVPTVFEIPPALPPAAMAMVVEVPPAPAQQPNFAKLDIRGDFQSEVRARVANFRAHQQRFLREREEYCSSTMDKVRAAIRDNSELPRSGK